MEGNFTENTPGYYTVKLFELIEDFDPDQYGNRWYNVLFEGDAETFMWLKKDSPTEGQKVYGHIEKTKSGKRLRFKTDKVPEGSPGVSGSSKSKEDYEPGTNARWAIGMAYRAYVNITGNPEGDDGNFPFEQVKEHAIALVKMFEEVKDSGSNGSLPSNEKATVEKNPSPSTSSSLGDNWKKATGTKAVSWNDEPPLDDEDIPGEV